MPLFRFDKRYFERFFASKDPWRYSVSEYERTKYLRQLAAIQEFCPRPQSILEAGCAEGVFTEMLSRAFPQASITGMDISPTAIERAKDKCKNHPNITFVEADIVQLFCHDLPPLQHFDVIIQSESLHYIFVPLFFQRKLRSYLEAVVGYLNEGGIFVTSNGINIQTRFMLLICYSILGKLCSPVWTATYKEWSDYRRRHIRYDLRVFRAAFAP